MADAIKITEHDATTGAQDIVDNAIATFAGWHHTSAGIVQKTVHACIVKDSVFYQKTIKSLLDEKYIVNISDTNTVNQKRKMAQLLYNNGATLQNRSDNMILTRPVYALVKGPAVNHAATLCIVKGYIKLTPAFTLVEARAISNLIEEAKKLILPQNDTQSFLSVIVETEKKFATSLTPQGKKLAHSPTTDTLFTINKEVDIPSVVLLLQATAILITGYEDGGAKFRDRTSRHEAARHSGQAIRTILYGQKS